MVAVVAWFLEVGPFDLGLFLFFPTPLQPWRQAALSSFFSGLGLASPRIPTSDVFLRQASTRNKAKALPVDGSDRWYDGPCFQTATLTSLGSSKSRFLRRKSFSSHQKLLRLACPCQACPCCRTSSVSDRPSRPGWEFRV